MDISVLNAGVAVYFLPGPMKVLNNQMNLFGLPGGY
jgi:hypothetical protein